MTDNPIENYDNRLSFFNDNIEDLIDFHNELKAMSIYIGMMNNSRSSKLINVIMNNIFFYEENNECIIENTNYDSYEPDIVLNN